MLIIKVSLIYQIELIFDTHTSAKFLNSLPLNVLEKGLAVFWENVFERDDIIVKL